MNTSREESNKRTGGEHACSAHYDHHTAIAASLVGSIILQDHDVLTASQNLVLQDLQGPTSSLRGRSSVRIAHDQ